MKAQIRRLRLRRGDILIVKDLETSEKISRLGGILGLDFSIPIVIAPDGIRQMDRKHLQKLLDKLETIA